MIQSPRLLVLAGVPAAAGGLFHNVVHRSSALSLCHCLPVVIVIWIVLIAAAAAQELLPRCLILRLIVPVSLPATVAHEVLPGTSLAILMGRALPIALMLLRQGVPRAHEGLARVLPLRLRRRLLVPIQGLQVSHRLLGLDLCVLVLLMAGHCDLAGAFELRLQVLWGRVRCCGRRALARSVSLLPARGLRPR